MLEAQHAAAVWESSTHEEAELAAADEAAVDVLVRRLQLPAAVRVGSHLSQQVKRRVGTACAQPAGLGQLGAAKLTAWIQAIHDTACSSDAGNGWTSCSICGAVRRITSLVDGSTYE